MFTPEQMQWLEQQFERCWPMLERAVKKMREPYTREHVWTRVENGTAQLFPGEKSAVLTEINDRADGSRYAHVWLAGGDFNEVVSLAGKAENVARKAGCTAMTFSGRPGFMGKTPPGYRLTAVVMRKDL